MPDRWKILDDDYGVRLERNGSWFTDLDDVEEGVAIVRNRRAKEVVILHKDGYQETQRF